MLDGSTCRLQQAVAITAHNARSTRRRSSNREGKKLPT